MITKVKKYTNISSWYIPMIIQYIIMQKDILCNKTTQLKHLIVKYIKQHAAHKSLWNTAILVKTKLFAYLWITFKVRILSSTCNYTKSFKIVVSFAY